MRRREFITLLGGAATWPLAARAQQPRRVAALIHSTADDAIYQSRVAGFQRSLRSLGWIEGKNLQLDIRWDELDPETTHRHAVELAALAPDVILTSGTAGLAAMQRATRTIPIVFMQVSDPVAQGFVTSLAHPGGNITGFAAYEFSVGGKWLDLLRQMVPDLRRAPVMFNPGNSAAVQAVWHGRGCERPLYRGYRRFMRCVVLVQFTSQGYVARTESGNGLPGKPDGMTGAEVEKYYRDGHIREIADYCESDVVNTYRAWLRYELFRGRLSEPEFQGSEANLLEFVMARGNTKPHLTGLL
jgi:hypothetical protein